MIHITIVWILAYN